MPGAMTWWCGSTRLWRELISERTKAALAAAPAAGKARAAGPATRDIDPTEALTPALRPWRGGRRGQRYGADLRDRVLAATGETIRRCLQDLIAGGEIEWVGIIAARGQTQCERQVGWPDVDGVEVGRGADGMEVGKAFLGLDHVHGDDRRWHGPRSRRYQQGADGPRRWADSGTEGAPATVRTAAERRP
jgi:hypothetical protein